MSRHALAFAAVFAVALAAGAGYQVAHSPRARTVLIAVTNEVRGRDRRCGCQGARPAPVEATKVYVPVCSCSQKNTFASVAHVLPDLGGLPERSAWLAVARREAPLVSLDTGDLLFPRLDPTDVERPEWRRRARLLIEGYDILGVAALTPGETDLALGRDALVEILRGGKLATVAANLVDKKSGSPLFPGRTRIRVGGGSDVTIGVVGIFAPPETPELARLLEREGLEARDPRAALAAEVAALQGEGCDLVVLLAHAPEPRVRELVGAVPGIDLAFAAHAEVSSGEHGHMVGATAVAQALRGGGAPLLARVTVQPGGHGVVDESVLQEARAWTGRLERQLADETGSLPQARDAVAREKLEEQIVYTKGKLGENRAVLSGPPRHRISLAAVPLQASEWREGKDPRLLAAVDRFKTEVAATPIPADVVARLEQGVAFKTASKCADCHKKQAAVWEKSPHARAWESLTKAHDERDPECVRCHSIGFRAPGGFATTDRAVRPMDEHPEVSMDFRNVQCEACHGPRAEHPMTRGIGIHIPGVETCRACHDPEHDPTFSSSRIDEARKRGVVLCTRN